MTHRGARRRPAFSGAPRLPRFRGDLLDDPGALDAWSGASGPVWIPPAAVARPEGLEDLKTLVAWAADTGTPLIPRGGGTGMPGGNVGRGVIVDLTHFDEVRALPGGGVRAGAGAIAARARAAARTLGRDLPALPSSAARCTVGGIVANDAAGARSFRYGPSHAWVECLEIVDATGEARTLRRGDPPDARARALHAELASTLPTPLPWPDVRKNASGYALDRFLPSRDPLDLQIGSEGTLGIVVAAELRTHPLPTARGVALLGVPDRALLPEWAALAHSVDATTCEWFGERLLELGGLGEDPRLHGLRSDRGVCLIEVIGDDVDAVEARLAALRDGAGTGARNPGCTTTSDEARIEAIWRLRHDASPRIAARAGPTRRSAQFIEDCVVPLDALPRWLDAIDALLRAHRIDAVLFGHAGDGNIHINPLLDLTRPDWREGARALLDEVVGAVAEAGGTLSGEHGDGRLRAPYLERIWGARIVAGFRRVKDAHDPLGIFNPGVILPRDAQDPFEGFGAGPEFGASGRDPAAGEPAESRTPIEPRTPTESRTPIEPRTPTESRGP
ncbi:MAG: FAD-binding oxidoreductase, partial [Longimicrobiales bacterium]|nr:FAD-binding oxidoreductase [Longimicrobiales bacterium]